MQDYQRRHDADPFAHGAAVERWGREMEKVFETFNTRLLEHEREISKLDRWRWRVEGGIWTVAAMIGGGLLGLIGHILGRW